jgi:hypothetical protein
MFSSPIAPVLARCTHLPLENKHGHSRAAPLSAFFISHACLILSVLGSSSTMSLPDPALSPLNFIYACSVCCRSFADVYEGHSETVQGLSDGINRKQRLVTRVWLASCCHVFCSSHMDGGGQFGLLMAQIRLRFTRPVLSP